jgi:hypothetical protein
MAHAVVCSIVDGPTREALKQQGPLFDGHNDHQPYVRFTVTAIGLDRWSEFVKIKTITRHDSSGNILEITGINSNGRLTRILYYFRSKDRGILEYKPE